MPFNAALEGTWTMIHDGLEGTLVVDASDQFFQTIDGNCEFGYYEVSGSWSGGSGTGLAMRGTSGGKDTNRRTGEPCPASAHKFGFTIAFPGNDPQPFEGYLFTHDETRMAGLTWWEGQPFAWFATKN